MRSSSSSSSSFVGWLVGWQLVGREAGIPPRDDRHLAFGAERLAVFGAGVRHGRHSAAGRRRVQTLQRRRQGRPAGNPPHAASVMSQLMELGRSWAAIHNTTGSGPGPGSTDDGASRGSPTPLPIPRVGDRRPTRRVVAYFIRMAARFRCGKR